MTQQKNARLITVPMVMDPSFETAYLTARHELDEASQRLLATAGDRIRAARAGAVTDEEAVVAANGVAVGDGAVLAQFEARVEAAKAELDEHTQPFKFRALGRKTFKALYADHPPKQEDLDEWKASGEEGEPPYNEDGFARELIVRSCVTPSLTATQVDAMFDGEDWNAAELGLLFVAAQHIQTQGPQA